MTRFAQRLGEKHHNFKSRKKDYLHLAEVFHNCSDLKEAHCISACVFGLMHTRHLWAATKDTEDIYTEIWDSKPTEAIINPRIRNYREKTKPQAIISYPQEKENMLKEYLLEKEAEERLIGEIMENKRIVFNQLKTTDPYIRKTLLNWIGKSMANKQGVAKTQTGQKFKLSKINDKMITIAWEDGTLKLPNFAIEFLGIGAKYMDLNGKVTFDELAQEGARYILENFWILRDKDPEIYQQIRQRENILRNFFLEKLGLNLIVHRQFIKLEKFPVEPESWMGIEKFSHIRDYTLFCCLLAFIEGKNVDEQFLLSDLCEELRSVFPADEELDWTHYEHRKSLVRVLQVAGELNLVKTVDGDITDFNYSENNEVLYEVPLVARYFLRSFPKDLSNFKSLEDFIDMEDLNSEEHLGSKRRQRVYRKLFLTPVIYSKGNSDPDFLYLRNYRNRIREDIERYSDLQFELYRNTALLTAQEKKAIFTLFPDNKAISDIVLQFAHVVREEKNKEDIPTQYDGSLCLTQVDLASWVSKCKEQYGHGWSKQYREATISEVTRDLLEVLLDWNMAAIEEETRVICLKPLLARTIGKYPRDFTKGGDSNGEG